MNRRRLGLLVVIGGGIAALGVVLGMIYKIVNDASTAAIVVHAVMAVSFSLVVFFGYRMRRDADVGGR